MLCAVRGRDRPLPRTVTQVQMIVIPAAMRQRSFYLHNSPQYPHVCARCARGALACGAGRAGPGTADPPGAADASDPAGPPGAVDPSGAAAKPYIFPPLSDKSPVELLAAKQKCMILGLADGTRAGVRGSIEACGPKLASPRLCVSNSKSPRLARANQGLSKRKGADPRTWRRTSCRRGPSCPLRQRRGQRGSACRSSGRSA